MPRRKKAVDSPSTNKKANILSETQADSKKDPESEFTELMLRMHSEIANIGQTIERPLTIADLESLISSTMDGIQNVYFGIRRDAIIRLVKD
ncbi:MAG: hypothetical protein LBQ79_11580 [Deltaproteobacteria bacterium]|jgi:hypothetical protein|nr:hypothetical protein [Deltaproteobacteria bacterium]